MSIRILSKGTIFKAHTVHGRGYKMYVRPNAPQKQEEDK